MSDLSSIYLVALPITILTTEEKNCIARAYTYFDLKQAQTIETGGWIHHSSAYEILHFDDLPEVVNKQYAETFFNDPVIKQNFDVKKTPIKEMSLFEQLQASL